MHDRSVAARRVIGPAVLSLIALAVAAALIAVATKGAPQPSSMEDRVRGIASTLRCPVCQGLSVADSPSSLARHMRDEIARQLRAGRSPDEIKGSFVASYGEWILLSPERRGFNAVAWLMPPLLLLLGLVAVGLAIRRWTAGSGVDPSKASSQTGEGEEPDQLSASDRRLLDKALAGAGDEA